MFGLLGPLLVKSGRPGLRVVCFKNFSKATFLFSGPLRYIFEQSAHETNLMKKRSVTLKCDLDREVFTWNTRTAEYNDIFLRICSKDFLISCNTILEGASEVQIDFFY